MASRFATSASRLAIIRASGDWVLGGLGIGAATASAGFAAYMLAFGPPELIPVSGFTVFASYDRLHVAEPKAGPTHGSPATVTRSADASPARTDPAPGGVDFTPTGSIGAPGDAGAADAKPKPGPGATPTSLSAFTLRDVFDGEALVETRSSLSVVKPGSMLDGAGEVLSIEKRGANWVVLTANGVIAQRR